MVSVADDIVPPAADPLNPRQRLFVEEYVKDFNATQAAIRAGYSPDTAYSIGHENLSMPDIAAAIALAKAERLKRVHMSADEVLADLAEISRTTFRDLVEWDGDRATLKPSAELTEAQAKAVRRVRIKRTVHRQRGGGETETVETDVELHDAVRTRELIARHVGIGDKGALEVQADGGSLTIRLVPAVPPGAGQ